MFERKLTHTGMSRLKNTFFKIVGSDKTIFITIDVKTIEKFTVNACDRVVTIVEKKKAIMM